jgi:biotin carboxyl carrier protein
VNVDIEIHGRRRRVQLERTADGWIVALDGRELVVDAVRVPSGWSLLVRPREEASANPNTGASASYDASVDDHGQGDLTVRVSGRAISARVVDPRAARRRGRDQSAAGSSGAKRVVAPMPGRVVKVLVKPGERVAARQGLVVVEAMKMENELRASGDAVVRDVCVTEGASVEAGAVLVLLE